MAFQICMQALNEKMHAFVITSLNVYTALTVALCQLHKWIKTTFPVVSGLTIVDARGTEKDAGLLKWSFSALTKSS